MCWPYTRKKEKQNFVKLKEQNKDVIKKLRLNEDCAVCLSGILVLQAIICSNCGNIMHKKCLKQWENACKKNRVPFSCPLCRTELEGLKND